jgi:hypothetical protein
MIAVTAKKPAGRASSREDPRRKSKVGTEEDGGHRLSPPEGSALGGREEDDRARRGQRGDQHVPTDQGVGKPASQDAAPGDQGGRPPSTNVGLEGQVQDPSGGGVEESRSHRIGAEEPFVESGASVAIPQQRVEQITEEREGGDPEGPAAVAPAEAAVVPREQETDQQDGDEHRGERPDTGQTQGEGFRNSRLLPRSAEAKRDGSTRVRGDFDAQRDGRILRECTLERRRRIGEEMGQP